jgi:hypothetical protein
MRAHIIIEHAGFKVEDFGFGLTIYNRNTNQDVWLQGEDASLCRDELIDLLADHEMPNTRASRFTKAQILDHVLGVYF